MRVGILGGGQLGRMLAWAGIPMNIECVLFDPAPDACGQSLGKFINAPFTDEACLQAFADQLDVITVEFEHIPVTSLAWLSQRVPLYPPPLAVATAQDRLLEKQLFDRLEIPTAQYQAIDDQHTFMSYCAEKAAANAHSLIAKSRCAGYDGKGQVRIKADTNLTEAWAALAGKPLIVEETVDFLREVSLIAVRGKQGDTVFYPLCENTHANGILHCTKVRLNDPCQQQAQDYAKRVMDALDYVGVLTFEFFDCEAQLLANEIAPRVHNSGHWSIEGADSSQFENHVRAICGMPLGSTETRGPSAMINLIGEMPARDAVLAVEGAHWHDYGKAPRAGRKLGHITLRANNQQQFDERLAKLASTLDNTAAPVGVCKA
jgi:5-(carboxyamino)imidazole ribonucleotide synthase